MFGVIVLFIILILILIVGIGAGIIIYSIIYNRRINKVIKEEAAGSANYYENAANLDPPSGESGQANEPRKIWPSLRVVILTIACSILLVFTAALIFGFSPLSTEGDGHLGATYYDGQEIVTSQEIKYTPYAYYASAFTTKKLDGYSVEEKTQGDFYYLIFKQTEINDGLKPQFLVFVSCQGENKEVIATCDLINRNTDSSGLTIRANASEYVLFLGNLGDYSEFDVNVYLYEDEDAADQEFDAYCEGNLVNYENNIDQLHLEIE